MAYNKDPWKGLIRKDGKPVGSPFANPASAGAPGNKSNPYDAMVACSFGTHISRCKMAARNAWSATTRRTSPPITPRIVPSLSSLVSSWSSVPQRMAATRHPALVKVRPPPPHPLLPHPLLPHPLPPPMGDWPAHPELSRRPPRRKATIPERSSIMRASMKGRSCIVVNLGPMSLFTHRPPT